jgi:hypothetical protein
MDKSMKAHKVKESLSRLEGLCFMAALEGNANNVSAYLQRRASLQAVSTFPVLGMVAEKGYTEVARILLDAGADVNEGVEGTLFPPLILAVRSGHVQVARLLLERGADVKALSKSGSECIGVCCNAWSGRHHFSIAGMGRGYQCQVEARSDRLNVGRAQRPP